MDFPFLRICFLYKERKDVKKKTAIQTLNGHLWLNVGRDLYAKLILA